MSRLFKPKHPKLLLLTAMIVLAYILFSRPAIVATFKHLGTTQSYATSLIAGFLFAFGFSTPIALGIFLTIEPSNFFLASLIGGVGAVLGDLVILNGIRLWYQDEFTNLEHTKLVRRIKNMIRSQQSLRIQHYLLYVVAALIIILPVPDEVGVSLLAGFTHMKQGIFCVISFILHFTSILILFSIPY